MESTSSSSLSSLSSLDVATLKDNKFAKLAGLNEDVKGDVKKNVVPNLDDRQSPWGSIWISIAMQMLVGCQISIYYMSMWPYLSGLDKSSTMDFLGWVVAICSFGCSVANPVFGYWNQRTMSTATPTICGLVLMAIGQVLYGLLASIDVDIKYLMLAARFITGFGAGNIAVLRAYAAQASVPKDRLKAVSFGTAGFVLGISFGPAIQACFTPVGEKGFSIGALILNMYTLPAFLMAIIPLLCIPVIMYAFNEEYSGIIDEEDDDVDPNFVIPNYDKVPAYICIYLWVVCSMISTNIEVISTPISTVMYNWKDSQSVLYNGFIESSACIVSVFCNFLIGYTKVGQWEKRYQIVFGLIIFMAYHVCCYPWWFYDGPLDFIPHVGNSTHQDSSQHGGCLDSYTWCETSVRIPMWLYLFCYIIFFGIGFPFTGSPSGTLYSEILGPRKQGAMQGLYSFGGSFAQFIAPVIATMLFQRSGYKYVMVMQICSLGIALILVAVFWKRIVPLKMTPKQGKSVKYDKGTLYRL